MIIIQKTYCCRLNEANNRKREELEKLFSSAEKISSWIFNNKFFFDEKDFYKAVREENESFPSKPTQKVIERYKANGDIFSLREPIEPNLIYDNQMFNIQFSDRRKYFEAFLRISSTKKRKRMNIPLSGLWSIRKLREAKKIDRVEVKKHSNGSFYAHITASFECAELKKSDRDIGIDLNHKGIVSSDNLFYSMKKLIHNKDEARKNKSAKKNEKEFTKDFVHKITTSIIQDLQDKEVEVLFLEDLVHLTKNAIRKNKDQSIKRKRKKLNRRASSFPYSMIRSFLSYKATEKGIKVISSKEQTVNSSVECSKCGSKETHRHNRSTFYCFSCGLILHADLNAARNIERKGRALLNASKSEMTLHAAENKNAEVPTL